MIQLVLHGLLFSIVVVNASPVDRKSRPIDAAAEVRRLVHQANWASVGTISTGGDVAGYPMVTLLSTADSKIGAESTGDIYFYMLSMDMVALDTKKDNKITFMFSDAQEGDCNKRGVDPWSHQCARTMISGQVKKLKDGTDEYTRGMEAFLSRHPTAANWGTNSNHDFYLCKLDIKNVILFSGYGGYRSISPAEYYGGTDSIVSTDDEDMKMI